MSRSYTSLPPCASMACSGTALLMIIKRMPNLTLNTIRQLQSTEIYRKRKKWAPKSDNKSEIQNVRTISVLLILNVRADTSLFLTTGKI
jgi:hypothetical protein